MSSGILIFFVVTFFLHLVEGDYGGKALPNSTETSNSTNKYGDMAEDAVHTTTEDDGVVIQKAILAAEITPKASYYLIDPPNRGSKQYSDTLQALYDDNQEPSGQTGEIQFSSYADDSNLQSYTRSNDDSFNFFKNSEGSEEGESFGDINNFQYLESSSSKPLKLTKNSVTSNNPAQPKSYSSTYRNPTNIEIIHAKTIEVDGNDIDFSTFGSFDSSKNYKTRDTTHPELGTQSNLSTPSFLIRVEEQNQRLEDNRVSQIEATKSYIKEVEEAQKYAAKIQALQDEVVRSLQSSNRNPTDWDTNTDIMTHNTPSTITQSASFTKGDRTADDASTSFQTSKPNPSSWYDSGDTRNYIPPASSFNSKSSVSTKYDTTADDAFKSLQSSKPNPSSWYDSGATSNYLPPTSSSNSKPSVSTNYDKIADNAFTSLQSSKPNPSSWYDSGTTGNYIPPTTSPLNSKSYGSAAVGRTSQHEVFAGLEASNPNPSDLSTNGGTGTYLSPKTSPNVQTKGSTVGRPEAPGVGTVGFQNGHQRVPDYPSQSYPSHGSQDNSVTRFGWSSTSNQFGGFSQPIYYMGPLAIPVVLPSGFLAETEEVRLARIAHLKAVINALQNAPQWKMNVPVYW